MAIRKLGKKQLIRFIFNNFILSITVVIGVGCSFELILQLSRNIFQWVETRVFDATPLLNVNAPLRFTHPATMGMFSPFFLYTYHRYPMEDAVFKCEYQTREPFPIFKSAKWRKEGLPLQIKNDRIRVKTSISKVNDSSEMYNVLSILTIQLLEDCDFGSYTCEYHNPAPSAVKPGPAMSKDFWHRSSATHIPKPEPKCNCKPREPNNDESKHVELVEFYECFSEFLLIKMNETVINRLITPGSIFIEGALYSTVAEIEEIEMEVTGRDNDGTVDNCCTNLVLLYWCLFRGGRSTVSLPFTRTIVSDNGLYFIRYNCMCKNSYGIRQFRISRNFFNTTSRKRVTAEIVYPIKQRLFPIYTHPWSNTTSANDSEIYNNDNSCLDSGFSSPQCWAHGKFFESCIDLMFWYETGIIYLFILISGIVVYIIYRIVLRQCIRPILSVLLYGDKNKIPFPSVNGKPLNSLRPFNHHDNNGHENQITSLVQNEEEASHYQIYLSYDIENEFDSMLAKLIKDDLLSMGLTVFDSQKDVLVGRLEIEELQNATSRSSRFIVIASKGYVQHKDYEFNLIQAAIFGQNSKSKDRLLIIMSEGCEIKRLYQVPCILVSEDSKVRHAVDETTLEQFHTWEKSTRPKNKLCLIDKTIAIAVHKDHELTRAILILIGFILVILKRYFFWDF